MKSSNPVFARSEGFNGRVDPNAYPNPVGGYAGFGDAPTTHQMPGAVARSAMSIDSVVQKTGITLGVLVIAAAATWMFSGDPTGFGVNAEAAARNLYVLSMVGAFGAFILSLVNSFKKVVSPALVLAFAALEGVFLGATSKVFQLAFGPGVVPGAVIGTIGAFAGTLIAYRFFHIKVGDKFRMWVVGAMFGFVGVSLLNMVLGFFGADFGFNGFGTMGLIASAIGLGLGVLMLILDFDFVERGIAVGLPENESWRAAFGLTVSLVWIYINLLRILAILRGD
ncbi:MAG TPA: Bax inhibitor-1/YccA family protein [Marmoricola sp.]|nr:Bax inhibitor-1/YccA family protein [Marmoricola sp.]